MIRLALRVILKYVTVNGQYIDIGDIFGYQYRYIDPPLSHILFDVLDCIVLTTNKLTTDCLLMSIEEFAIFHYCICLSQ